MGLRLYNPRSVVLALTDNQLRNYRTSSEPYDELFYYIRHNIEDVRDDLVLMISGERIPADIEQYAAVSMEINSREQIYSAMVVYGLLTYNSGEVLVPDKELMDKYNEMLLSKDSLGYVYSLAKRSEQMLKATLAGDTKVIEDILQFAHFIFYPEHKDEDGIVLELKIDGTPEKAVTRIKNKKYALRFMGRLGKEGQYTGQILAVGISYNRKTKEHSCKVEVLNI